MDKSNETKTTIHIRIDGLIRDYCSNFLSYLYLKRGWKRTMFNIGKENVIDEKTRIIITNVGIIMITCSSMANLLETIEFLVNEFEYGRMKNYLVWNENTTIKTNYITTIPLSDYCYEEKEDLISDYGTCSIYKNLITLKYESYDNGYLLISKIRDVFFLPELPFISIKSLSEDVTNEKESQETQESQESQESQIKPESPIEDKFRQSSFESAEEQIGNVLKSEVFIFSALILWSTAKILESV